MWFSDGVFDVIPALGFLGYSTGSAVRFRSLPKSGGDPVIGFKHEIPKLNANFGALYERFEP